MIIVDEDACAPLDTDCPGLAGYKSRACLEAFSRRPRVLGGRLGADTRDSDRLIVM